MKAFKIGDYVKWTCKLLRSSEEHHGRIVKIFESTAGARKKCLCARVDIHSDYPHDRRTTTIALHNLRFK